MTAPSAAKLFTGLANILEAIAAGAAMDWRRYVGLMLDGTAAPDMGAARARGERGPLVQPGGLRGR